MLELSFPIKRISILLSVAMTFCVPALVTARIVEHWTYREMFDKADLVAIAGVVSTKDTDEHSLLLDEIKVIGVTTEFRTFLILKGSKTLETLQLHHYRLQSENHENIANGPDLVRIPKYPASFLLS